MSDMKCPFCQQELDYLAEDIYGNMYCPNCRDKNGFTYKASESIWQELIRTRKALDCAINTLDTIYGMSEDDGNIETYIKCKRIEINSIIKGGDNE